MRYEDKIKGYGGGGGKDGGGSSHVPSEAPDSLRSKAYARVLDLISEGEIEGLVNGLQSVFLDDTPLQNEDGSFNFTGVVFDTRVGTQNQTYIPGFDGIESETAVSTEVKYGAPVTRSITDANVNSVRVTVSVPQLTYQNPNNGDLSGTSVQFKISIQNSGGGFVDYPVNKKWDSASFTITSGVAVGTLAGTDFTLGVSWKGAVSLALQTATVNLQYRIAGSGGAWTTAKSLTFSGRGTTTFHEGSVGVPSSTTYNAPTGSASVTLTLPSGAYEFRTTTAGTGSSAVSSAAVQTGDPTITISGKTTSRYQRSYKVNLTGTGPWDIRVSRLTADSTHAYISNKTYWDSYTAIVDAKLSYPNSALCGLQIDAAQFRSIPSRGYEIKGLKIQIPSNYDPLLRTYTGTWDGTFTIAWSDNPAWVFYDLLTDERYGLGAYLSAYPVDKWALYSIAQYCDEMVSDGFGGLEPRFTCNLYLQTREDAYKVLNNLASIFRAFTYWSAGSITAVQDKPTDPVALFTAANVIDGSFSYQGSSRRARHTVAVVTWNDPADMYRQKLEYVADQDGIARYGVVQTEFVAFGCTSRGQAHRAGRWLLYTERMETETATWRAGIEGNFVYPGAVVKCLDPIRSGQRYGGRITSSTTTQVTLDANQTIIAGKTYTLNCVLPDGSVEARTITNSPGTTSIMNVSPAFSSAPQTNAIWVMDSSDLSPELWRVVSVTEVDRANYEITAVSYNELKFDAVENDLILEPLVTSSINTGSSPVDSISVTESLTLVGISNVGVKALVSWPSVLGASKYIFSYRLQDGGIATDVNVTTPAYEINPIDPGTYEFSVIAVNILGVRSRITTVTQEILGKTLPPADLTGLSVIASSGVAVVSWDASQDLDVLVGGSIVIRHSPDVVGATWANSVVLEEYPGSAISGLAPLMTGTYFAKAVDSSGNYSINSVSFVASEGMVTGFTTVATSTQHPNFQGLKTLTFLDSTIGLELSGTSLFDSATEMFDSNDLFDFVSDVSPTGEYLFDNYLDFATKAVRRIQVTLKATQFDTGMYFDSTVEMFDSSDNFDGAIVNDCDVTIYIATTDDDPAGTPTWGAWTPFFVADFNCRAAKFKAVLTSQSPQHNIAITQLSVAAKVPA